MREENKNIHNSTAVPVSVLIPCYGSAGTIARAVESVAAQSVLPAEVILIDDCSQDAGKTVSELHRLQEQYADRLPIKVISLPKNVGAGGSRNAGWGVASQPYIAFLDADDAWHPRKLEIQYAYMSANPDVVLCGHGHRLLQHKDEHPDWEVGPWEARPVHKWELLLSNRFTTPSAMVRRDVTPRFVEGQRYMEDHMLWLLLVCGGGQVVKLSAELAAIYKRSFGVAGLSAQVGPMGRGDLGNYRRLHRAGCINALQLGVLGFYSALKHLRRLMIYWSFLRWKK
jgi:glycosyltransferase involved in cell wall biosynthesis